MDSNQNGHSVLALVGRAVVSAVLVLLVARCDFVGPAERHSLVVEAFPTTGAPLPTITLRQTRPLGDPGNARANAALDATVELVLDGRTVSYEAAEGRTGQYVPSEEGELVRARSPWQLTVQWRGETAHARGTTPPPIELSEMCVTVSPSPVQAVLLDSLRRDSLDVPAEQGYLYPVDVSLRWSADRLPVSEDTTHWVRPRLSPDTTQSSSRVVNFFLEPVEVRREDRFRVVGNERRWQGVYAVPVEDSTSDFPRHTVTASLVRGDTSFAAFARSRNDPERREPISNVEGALGVATAVAVDSIAQDVTSGLEECYSR